MSQTTALYHLQTLDSQSDAINKRLTEINRLLGQNEAVRRAQAALDQAKATLQHWRTRLADLDLERRKLREEADDIERRLYSGAVQNPRELTDLQGKLTELRRRHESLEEPAIEAMLEAESSEAALESAQADFERVTAEQAEAAGALSDERDQLLTKLASLRQQVESVRARIEPANLRQYDSLRQRPGGIAVAKVSPGGECSACGVGLTSGLKQRVRHGEVLNCPTCGRILYHP